MKRERTNYIAAGEAFFFHVFFCLFQLISMCSAFEVLERERGREKSPIYILHKALCALGIIAKQRALFNQRAPGKWEKVFFFLSEALLFDWSRQLVKEPFLSLSSDDDAISIRAALSFLLHHLGLGDDEEYKMTRQPGLKWQPTKMRRDMRFRILKWWLKIPSIAPIYIIALILR